MFQSCYHIVHRLFFPSSLHSCLCILMVSIKKFKVALSEHNPSNLSKMTLTGRLNEGPFVGHLDFCSPLQFSWN